MVYISAVQTQEVIASLGEIKQNLSTIAGVNTSMDLDFKNVK